MGCCVIWKLRVRARRRRTGTLHGGCKTVPGRRCGVATLHSTLARNASAFKLDRERADDADRTASAFLATLTGRKRCAMLFRIQNASKPDTRARKIEAFIGMLNRGAAIHP
ncbi:YdeI/OmpD-associated family protein [Burkholderia dolosa]|nr:YdeI/OmpD-associated family protein [Burkholderia dolosa]MBY4753001.1 YdeI/OmpD-associated family protein [Burkholderia dolosa]